MRTLGACLVWLAIFAIGGLALVVIVKTGAWRF